MPRGYCWRVGSAIEVTTPCQECGSKTPHPLLANQALCGGFATCPVDSSHGHPCEREYPHQGTCAIDADSIHRLGGEVHCDG